MSESASHLVAEILSENQNDYHLHILFIGSAVDCKKFAKEYENPFRLRLIIVEKDPLEMNSKRIDIVH
jgi:hypothetical protein